jgi:hypothetical protein
MHYSHHLRQQMLAMAHHLGPCTSSLPSIWLCFTAGVPDTLLPEGLAGKAVGSPVVAEIAALARPR